MLHPYHSRHSVITIDSPLGSYRMAYREHWRGEASAPPSQTPRLMAVHGLTRVAADFDRLAEALSQNMVVICPDIVGRGNSDWLPPDHDGSHYNIATYAADCLTLIRSLGLSQVDWLGTSMGGLIGIALAHQSMKEPEPLIHRLILNDIGIRIPKESLLRISQYVGVSPSWDSRDAALSFYQTNYANFGITELADWKKFTDDSIRWRDGKWRAHYDPNIRLAFAMQTEHDVDLSPIISALTLPILVIRGQHSDVLLAEDYARMLKSPTIQGVVMPRCGHAPALLDSQSHHLIAEFLSR